MLWVGIPLLPKLKIPLKSIVFAWKPPLSKKEIGIAQKTYFHLVSQSATYYTTLQTIRQTILTFDYPHEGAVSSPFDLRFLSLQLCEFEELIKNLIEQCPKERQEWLRIKLTHARNLLNLFRNMECTPERETASSLFHVWNCVILDEYGLAPLGLKIERNMFWTQLYTPDVQ